MSLTRAQQLLSMNRPEEAEAQLRLALADDPEDDLAHGLLSLCLSSTKNYKAAHSEAEIAIGIDPTNDMHYFAKANAFIGENRYKKAEEWLLQAVAIDPEDSDYYAALASCRMQRDDFKGALEYSTLAVECDPEDQDATDVHIIILNRLGRREEADALLEGALHRNPHNDYAHANQGWAELHKNNPKKALVHFQEALRLDPNNEYARNGLVEALKAGNPIYRLFLLYVLWLGKLSPNVRWGVLLGGYAVFRLADRAAYAWPEYALFFTPFIYAYFAFAILTWLADPLFNLLLFVHPLGRHALSERERFSSLIASVFLVIAGAGCVLFFCGYHSIFLLIALFSAMMVPHVHQASEVEHSRHKKVYIACCAALCVSGISALSLIYMEEIFGAKLWNYTIYGWIAYMFLGTFLTTEAD